MTTESSTGARAQIMRAMRAALLQIRSEAVEGGDMRTIATLSDLVHTLPSALAAPEPDYDAILDSLKKRAAEMPGETEDWLKSNMEGD